MKNRDPLDKAIAAKLDAEAKKVDAQAMLARIKAAGVSPKVPPTRRHWLRWAVRSTAAVLAAGFLLTLFINLNMPHVPSQLSAAELLTITKSDLETTPTDRAYDVEADWELVPFKRGFQFNPFTKKAKVWTRGDQFVMLSAVEDGPPRSQWAWGQEASGRVWLAPGPKNAVVFQKDELNEPLANFCDLMSLRLVSTLGELLEKYDLLRRDSGQPGEPIRIEAKLRPGLVLGQGYRQVELELDPTTKVVRSAVLHRYLNGESIGTLRFTLVETAKQSDKFFTLAAHVDANAVIHDGRPLPMVPNRPNFREELLKRLQNRGK